MVLDQRGYWRPSVAPNLVASGGAMEGLKVEGGRRDETVNVKVKVSGEIR